jgi:hypothetical protein
MTTQTQVAEVARDSHTESLTQEEFVVTMKELREYYERQFNDLERKLQAVAGLNPPAPF